MVSENIKGLATCVTRKTSRCFWEHRKPHMKVSEQLVFPSGETGTDVVVGNHAEPGARVFFGLISKTNLIAQWKVGRKHLLQLDLVGSEVLLEILVV